MLFIKKFFKLMMPSVFFFGGYLMAQPNFTVYAEGNPVIGKGTLGSWDYFGAWFSCVSVINDTFYVTYVGIADPAAPVSMGLAISTDGFNYTKSTSNPILWGDSTGFDASSVSSGLLFYDSGAWYLYYSGRETFSFQPGKVISVASATNPHGPWNRSNDTLFTTGISGEWDDGNISPMSILVEGNSLYMYYLGGHDWSGTAAMQIGLAISNDNGQTWVKWDDLSTTSAPFAESDPVLKLGPDAYDNGSIRGAGIIKNGSGWEMLYNGSTTSPISGDICYATSDDGIHWNKHASNPILTYLSDPLTINGWFEGATVALHENQYFLYYDYGAAADGIGLATAPWVTSIESISYKNISKFVLNQNYPNPFNPVTTVEFNIPKSEFVTLEIYNLLGQEVATLVSEKLKAGNYKYTWDATDLASGLYLYKLEAGNYLQTRKMLLIK